MATKLFVGNLPHSTTDASLGEFVTGAGFQIASAVVIRDKMTGTPRGFGFVELGEGEDLQRAIAGLNGQSLDGRPLTVNEARPQRTDFSRPAGVAVGMALAVGEIIKVDKLNRARVSAEGFRNRLKVSRRASGAGSALGCGGISS